MQAPSLKRPLEIGKARNVLYFLYAKCQSSASHCSSFTSLTATSSPSINSCKPNDVCDISEPNALCDISISQAHSPSPIPSVNTYSSHNKEACSSHDSSLINCSSSGKSVNSLWHNRLGHVPFIKMKGISSIPVQFANKQPFLCHICSVARQTRSSFPQKSRTSTNRPFDILHIDIWGLYHESTYNNYKYFVTMVDDYTRSTWTHLMSSKANTLQILMAFVCMVENQFQTSIKTIRSDNGLEFTSNEAKTFYQSKGIIHQRSCPYTPQQNGVVERKHKYLLEIARTLLYQSKLPIRYWGGCLITTTYLINRLPSVSLKGKCPY